VDNFTYHGGNACSLPSVGDCLGRENAYDGASKVVARYANGGGDDHDLWDAQTVT
jgi:hypothetical protein